MLSPRSRTQKTTYRVRAFIRNVWNGQVHRDRAQSHGYQGPEGERRGIQGCRSWVSLGLQMHGSWVLRTTEPLYIPTDTQTAHSDRVACESTSQSNISTGGQAGRQAKPRDSSIKTSSHTPDVTQRDPATAYLGEVSSDVSPCRRGHRWLPVDVPGQRRSGQNPAMSIQGSQALGRLSTSEHGGSTQQQWPVLHPEPADPAAPQPRIRVGSEGTHRADSVLGLQALLVQPVGGQGPLLGVPPTRERPTQGIHLRPPVPWPEHQLECPAILNRWHPQPPWALIHQAMPSPRVFDPNTPKQGSLGLSTYSPVMGCTVPQKHKLQS